MTGFLSDQEISELTPSELAPHRTPTQIVASDEYYPGPLVQEQQRAACAACLKDADSQNE